jgi:DNA repair exonuclease SbcCD nuclease subunit
MRVCVFSDTHLGYGRGSETYEDSFRALDEVIRRGLDCDLILVAGDLFDSRNPDAEVLTRAMETLIPTLTKDNGSRIAGVVDRKAEDLKPIHDQGIPVVMIHGTHERRVKGLLNPVQALEKAGFAVHLHCNGIIIGKGDEKVCIQGMSGVPDQFAESVLSSWKPGPVRGCYNVFMIHQSLSPFMYSPHAMSVENLPKGFDLYVSGHVHESQEAEYSGKPFLIPGSMTRTQMTGDSEKPLGFFIVDTKGGIEFHELENQRGFYFIEMKEEGLGEIEKRLGEIAGREHGPKPLVRVRVKGERREIPTRELEERFSGKMILSFRTSFEEREIKRVGIEEHRLSVNELGRKILGENLKSGGLDAGLFERIFELLLHRKPDAALDVLRKEGSDTVTGKGKKEGIGRFVG